MKESNEDYIRLKVKKNLKTQLIRFQKSGDRPKGWVRDKFLSLNADLLVTL